MACRGWSIGYLLAALLLAAPEMVHADDDIGCLAGCGEPRTAPPSCEAGCFAALPAIKLKSTTLDDGAHGAELIGASVSTTTDAEPRAATPVQTAPRLPKGHPKGARDSAPGAALHGNLSPLRY